MKEWLRKKIVSLKRKPQTIVLVMLVLATAYWLVTLNTYSSAVDNVATTAKWVGLALFGNTLFSVLVIALFGNAFPKRKKPNLVFIALLFVFMAVIIFCDVTYITCFKACISDVPMDGFIVLEGLEESVKNNILNSFTLSYVHIVLVGICALLLATLPLYSKLIRKINTRKEVVSSIEPSTNDVEIDLQETD